MLFQPNRANKQQNKRKKSDHSNKNLPYENEKNGNRKTSADKSQ